MATASHRAETAWVGALAGGGAGLGLLLAASRAGPPAADRCAAAVRRVGACPGTLVAVRPFVGAAVVGFLLGALIAIAAVLVWREARATAGPGRRRAARPRPRVAAPGRPPAHGGIFAPRTRH